MFHALVHTLTEPSEARGVGRSRLSRILNQARPFLFAYLIICVLPKNTLGIMHSHLGARFGASAPRKLQTQRVQELMGKIKYRPKPYSNGPKYQNTVCLWHVYGFCITYLGFWTLRRDKEEKITV